MPARISVLGLASSNLSSSSPTPPLTSSLASFRDQEKQLSTIISASTLAGHIAYQARSPETALECASFHGDRAGAEHASQRMHGSVYDPDAFVRPQAAGVTNEAV